MTHLHIHILLCHVALMDLSRENGIHSVQAHCCVSMLKMTVCIILLVYDRQGDPLGFPQKHCIKATLALSHSYRSFSREGCLISRVKPSMPSWNLFVKGQEGKTMNFIQEDDPTVS